MILYNGNTKGQTFKQLLWVAFWQLAKPIEKLEPGDFGKNWGVQ